MTRKQRTSLLGIHNGSFGQTVKGWLERDLGYTVILVGTLEEMSFYTQDRFFHGYLMDLNLGYPNTPDISSAEEIYGIVGDRVRRGEAIFLGTSGNEEAIKKSRERDIPCVEHGFDFYSTVIEKFGQ